VRSKRPGGGEEGRRRKFAQGEEKQTPCLFLERGIRPLKEKGLVRKQRRKGGDCKARGGGEGAAFGGLLSPEGGKGDVRNKENQNLRGGKRRGMVSAGWKGGAHGTSMSEGGGPTGGGGGGKSKGRKIIKVEFSTLY